METPINLTQTVIAPDSSLNNHFIEIFWTDLAGLMRHLRSRGSFYPPDNIG